MRTGFAGRVAHAFLDSKLTPLVIAASSSFGTSHFGARVFIAGGAFCSFAWKTSRKLLPFHGSTPVASS